MRAPRTRTAIPILGLTELPRALTTITPTPTGSPFGRFEFRMTEALIEQVVHYMRSRLSWNTLDRPTLGSVFQGPAHRAVGVYMLARRMRADTPRGTGTPDIACELDDDSGSWIRTVYVGQSQNTIVTRLRKHADFVRDRVHLAHADVVFKAAEIVIFNSVDVEGHLIGMFGSKWDPLDELSGWNNSGFGSNDTGTNRDNQATSKFDLRFPIDIFRGRADIFMTDALSPTTTAGEAITRLASQVPFTVRVQQLLRTHPDLAKPIALPVGVTNAYDACRLILAVLGQPWIAIVSAVRIVFQNTAAPTALVMSPGHWPPDFISSPNVVIEPP